MRPIAVLLALFCLAPLTWAAAPPYEPLLCGPTQNVFAFKEPFKVAVVGDTLLYHHREATQGFFVTVQPLKLEGNAKNRLYHIPLPFGSIPPNHSLYVANLSYFPVRFHVSPKKYYVLEADGLDSVKFEGLTTREVLRGFDLAGVVRRDPQESLSHSEEERSAGIHKVLSSAAVEGYPGIAARQFGRHSMFRHHVYYDYLPDADDKGARQFVLTDTRGRIIPPAEREKDGPTWEQSRFDRETPQWSFSVWHCPTRWDDKARRWTPGKWTKETELPVLFKEHFQVLADGETWFLLTNSGRLFCSPKPEGAPRVLKRVKLPGPVLGTITDAQTGKHFLFVNTPEGQAFFEPALKPKLVAFDPKAAKVPEGDDPLRGILHKARILAALGKIKGK